MLWKLFQLLIVAGVAASNIHWQWTPNLYLPALIGIAAAYLATKIIIWVIQLAAPKAAAPSGRGPRLEGP